MVRTIPRRLNRRQGPTFGDTVSLSSLFHSILNGMKALRGQFYTYNKV